MTKLALFSTFLHDAMLARRMPLDEFAHEVGDVEPRQLQSWLDGASLPKVEEVEAIARALRREPLEVVSAWLVDQLPDLHGPVARALTSLCPHFPPADDLAIRARYRRDLECMDVGDPHDRA